MNLVPARIGDAGPSQKKDGWFLGVRVSFFRRAFPFTLREVDSRWWDRSAAYLFAVLRKVVMIQDPF